MAVNARFEFPTMRPDMLQAAVPRPVSILDPHANDPGLFYSGTAGNDCRANFVFLLTDAQHLDQLDPGDFITE